MVLTERDQTLFRKLQTYGVFTTRQVAEFIFHGARLTTVLRRLRKLERGGYVQRINGLEGGEVAWALLQKGAEVVDAPAFKRHFRRDLLEHDLILTDLRLWLEDHRISRSWIPEHEIRSSVARKHGLRDMKNRIVPDGIMGTEIGTLKESVAIELELSFKNSGRYFRTFRQYQNKTSLWGIWYFVKNPGIGRQVEKVWKRANFYGTPIRFLWTVLDDVYSKGLEARIHGDGDGKNVSEIFQLKKREAAQTPAQRVSNQSTQREETVAELNTENEKEILAPAS